MIKAVVLCLRGGGADAKRRETRKRKFAHIQEEYAQHEQQGVKKPVAEDDEAVERTTAPPGKKAKRRKLEHSSAPVMEPERSTSTSDGGENDEEQEKDAPESKLAVAENPSKSQRFICFVGNLPYSTTDTALKSHFAKIQPSAIRHPSSKETGKSKGFAFLEFKGYDRMKTCLQLYHGSLFEVEGEAQGKDKKEGGRRINVELTAGGGGSKSQERRSRLAAKNAKLQEERKRRAEEEKRNSRKKAKHSKGPSEDTVENLDAIHPTRRARVANG